MLTGGRKRLFILGAGSSKCHMEGNFPGIGEFFSMAKDLKITTSPSGKVASRFSQLEDFLNTLFGWSLGRPSRSMDIEAVFTIAQIALERNTSIDHAAVNNQIKDLVSEVLLDLTQRLAPTVDANRNASYYLFSRRLELRDTILTFNWDTLLDGALKFRGASEAEAKELHSQTAQQYVNFRGRFLGNRGNDLEPPRQVFLTEPFSEWEGTWGYYLKMHGSIDWYSCDNRNCVLDGTLFEINHPGVMHYCGECGEPLNNNLIPPVQNKPLQSNPAIRRIWNVAAREMRVADDLIIWGYSLPATDFYSNWLLRQARSAKLKSLTLINPEVGQGRKTKRVGPYARRMREIFKNQFTTEQIRLFEEYADYLADIDVFAKHGISRKW